MKRTEIVRICEQEVLRTAATLYGESMDRFTKFEDSEGCENIVYKYIHDGELRVLRISFRPDRPVEAIRAELHFINYLAEGGVRVSKPVASTNGNELEVISAAGISFIIVSFVRGRGMRLPDNDYHYRKGVPIKEYYHNWGQMLGRMHRLTKTYKPLSGPAKRPEWHMETFYAGFPYGKRLPGIQEKYDQLLADLRALPRDIDSYGLIHHDFNDGNFTVDYNNGDITVFDFDDCCHFWFMYDIACAWEGGIGRAMFDPLAERRDFMKRYMEHILQGYALENTLSDVWLARLPLFLHLIQMEELTHYARYLDEGNVEIEEGLRYKKYCIEHDIPYMGFFDPVFDPEKPFMLGESS